MYIDFRGYNLDYFKDKDLYTVNEVIQKIEEMESTIHTLQEKLELAVIEKEEPDMHEDYVLGLL